MPVMPSINAFTSPVLAQGQPSEPEQLVHVGAECMPRVDISQNGQQHVIEFSMAQVVLL